MLKKKYECAKRWALGAIALLVMGNAIAAYTTNKFEPTQTVQGTRLQLNGAGIRFKALFKVYDVALYTTKQVNTAQELLSLAGPKKLSFVALRDISGTDLGVAFVRGMTTNTPTDLAHRQAISTNRLVEIFSGKHKLTEGDTFAIEYVPGKGTTFFINGEAQGKPIGDAEFFDAVLKIWVGPIPADFRLKEALLGSR